MSDEELEATHPKKYRIVVNGEDKTVDTDVITYEAITEIAWPGHAQDILYSVTFDKAKEPHEGELLQEQTVVIKDGTEFDVEPTGRS